jgi:hypothetical protein
MAMVYGVLTEQSVQGFFMEGEADRRLRASLLADRRMATLQAQIVQGTPPRLGTTEDREDGFDVRMDVRPFELPLRSLLPALPPALQTGSRNEDGVSVGPSLLAPSSRGTPPPFRTLEVEVSWDDGRQTRSVRRTLFALDRAAAGSLLEQAGGAAVGGPGGNEPDEGTDR